MNVTTTVIRPTDFATIDDLADVLGQGRDGAVHLTYYRRDKHLSFVWGGGPFILVSEGGYAEPVTTILAIEVDETDFDEADGLAFGEVLAQFQDLCDRHAEGRDQ